MNHSSITHTLSSIGEDPMFGLRSLTGAIVALAAIIALFDLTYLDLAAQDVFFNFRTGFWLIDSRTASPWAKLIFYDGIKGVIIIFAVLLIILSALPGQARRHCLDRLPKWLAWMRPAFLWKRRDVWVVIATLASAPLLVSIGKATTNIHYPCSIQRYGGATLYVRLFEQFPDDARPAKRSRGFPAGHASGGFALVSLAGLAATRRGRLAGLTIGLGAGWVMGLYQQMRGVHYLSHTLVTMLVCWVVFLLWRMTASAIERRVTVPRPVKTLGGKGEPDAR